MNLLTAAADGHAGLQHFSLGLWLVGLAYAVAVLGSVVGLACTRRSSLAPDLAGRQRWLVLAAVSIGGVAVWLMHFIAMLGMRTPGSVTRYDLGWTAISAFLSIGATYLALLMVGREVRWVRLIGAGTIMGSAVALMHYTGMRAVNVQGAMAYDVLLVAASVTIAVVASCVALWFTLTLHGSGARLVGGLIMGVAVVGMHYTGMAAMSFTPDAAAPTPAGLEVFTFLFPILVVGMLALAVPITAVMLTPEGERTDHLDLLVAEPVTELEPEPAQVDAANRTTVGVG